MLNSVRGNCRRLRLRRPCRCCYRLFSAVAFVDAAAAAVAVVAVVAVVPAVPAASVPFPATAAAAPVYYRCH